MGWSASADRAPLLPRFGCVGQPVPDRRPRALDSWAALEGSKALAGGTSRITPRCSDRGRDLLPHDPPEARDSIVSISSEKLWNFSSIISRGEVLRMVSLC